MAKEGFDERGKFAKGNQVAVGNKGGTGRPKRTVEERYLATLLRNVPQSDWAIMIKKLVTMAKSGDTTAFKLLGEYILGKPTARVKIAQVTEGELDAVLVAAMEQVYGSDDEVLESG